MLDANVLRCCITLQSKLEKITSSSIPAFLTCIKVLSTIPHSAVSVTDSCFISISSEIFPFVFERTSSRVGKGSILYTSLNQDPVLSRYYTGVIPFSPKPVVDIRFSSCIITGTPSLLNIRSNSIISAFISIASLNAECVFCGAKQLAPQCVITINLS